MFRHRYVWIVVGSLVLAIGCSWVNPRSAFERDPLVMSHLTNDRFDAGFAAADQPVKKGRWAWLTASHPGSPPVQAASLPTASPSTPKSSTAAPDHSWLIGRLRQRRGAEDGWYIQYGKVDDPDRYGGELDIEMTPKLGLVREGDRVLLEGEVVQLRSGQPVYRVRNIARLD